MSSAEVVPIRQAQAPVPWTHQQRDLIRQQVARDCSDAELSFFAQVCAHRGLDPFAGHIVVTRRDGRMVIQETAAGYRVIADRTGLYDGQSAPQWCGPDGRWVDVWLSKEPPAACRVEVYRKDFRAPVVGIARYSSYVQFAKGGGVTKIWSTGPDFMLWKCAEVAAFRRAFPEHIGGREIPPQSRVSMEARAAGLDDDGRHALISQVTNGRTSSSRDLTEGETYEVRAAIAQAAAEGDDEPTPGADPVTGEIVEEGPTWSERERQRLLAEIRGKAQTLSEAQWAKTYQALQKAGLGGEPAEMDLDELFAVDRILTRNPKSFASSTLPKDPPVSERPPQERGVSEAPTSPEPPDAGDSSQEETAGNPVSDGDPRPSSWERQIAEAAAEYALVDVNAIVWGCLGRKVALDDIANVQEREMVLAAFRNYATGDIELGFDEDGVPRLKEVPF